MAKIVLRLVPDTTQVSLALQNLKKEADSLNGKKVDLGIDAKQANAIASAARALASLQRAQNQAAAAQNKYNIETARAEKETAKFGQQIEKTKRLEDKLLPEDINYLAIDGLRIEARQKLDKIRPRSLGQASRISGVNPADIAVLMVYLKK